MARLRIQMGCLYRILCHATGRSYIGQTSLSYPFVRFMEHQRDAEKGHEGPLYDDMRTYGIHAFECICLCVVENVHLNNLECYYAEQYDAYVWDGGYNTGECGRTTVRPNLPDERRMWMKRRAIAKNYWGRR